MLPSGDPPRVVVVGGGFGGLAAARHFAGKPVQVTLVDRSNHHLFQPLLYQVATAGLSPADIASPLRSILRKARNVRVILAEARAIDVEHRRVILDRGALPYDALVLAAGARHSYFGHPEWESSAPGLKTLEDALEMRRRILLAYEAAEREDDDAERRALLTFVVVGGGPTGVELAGALAEISRQAIARDFRRIDPTQARIVLLEGGPHLLSAFPPDLQRAATSDLRRMGVDVFTGSQVTGVGPDHVRVGAETIRARTILWAAGVEASPLGGALGAPQDRAGRVRVQPDLSIPAHPEVFVIGDQALCTDSRGQLLPGLCPVAMQQGEAAADNALRRLRGAPTRPFHYIDRGTMATIGRKAAVAVIARVHLSGLIAWLAWVFLHIFMLIGFRNRVLVMVEWIWAYVTYGRGTRLITGDWKEKSP